MGYKKSLALLWLTVGIAVALAVVEFITKPEQTLALPALICVLLGLAQSILFFHCPHCKKRWDVRRGIPTYCPHCGKTITR